MKQAKFLWLCLMVLLFSCSKEAEEAIPKPETSTLIREAQTYFQAHYQPGEVATESSLNKYGARFTKVNWAMAKEKQISLGKAVVVPLIFENDVYVGLGKSNKRHSLSATTFLFMYKDAQQNMHTEVVRYVPNDAHVPGPKKPFLGLVVIEDISGSFKAGFYFDGEKAIPFTRSSQSEQVSVNSGTAVTSGWCTTTTYYSCPEVGNYPEDCAEVAQDTYCHDGGSDLDLLTKYYDYGGGDTEGGDGDISGGGGYSPSPATLFVTQIDDSNLDPCMQPIMNDVKNLSQGVGKIVTKLAGSTPGYNWTVADGSLSGGSGGTSTLYNFSTKTVVSTFDSNAWSDATDLSWARTILHESVHAYLTAYFAVNKPGWIATYPQMVQEWATFNNMNDVHHEEFARSLVNDIAIALQEYGVKKGYNLTQQFYNDMAWAGLQNTTAFLSLPLSDRNRILNTIAVELTGRDVNGNKIAQKGKNAGC